VSGNGPNGTADTVNMSNGTVNVTSGSVVKVVGTGDTINGGSNDTISLANSSLDALYVSGDNTFIADLGSGDTLNVTGLSETIIASSDTINLGASSQVTITGGGNNVHASNSDTLTIGGNLRSGADNYVYLSSSTNITIIDNSHVDVIGANDMITAGMNDTLGVGGSGGSTINIGGGSANLWVNSGTGYQVTAATGDTVHVGANVGANFTSTGDNILVGASGAQLTCSSENINVGSNETLLINGSLNVISLANGDQLTDSGDTITLASNATDTVTLNGTLMADSITLAAGDNLTASGDKITISSGLTETITGCGNTVNGATGDTLTIGGNGTGGSDNWVYISNATKITVTDNSHVDVIGANDMITAGMNDTLGVGGSGGSMINMGGGSANLWLNSGTGYQVTAATGDTVHVGANVGANFTSAGDNILVGASGAQLTCSSEMITVGTGYTSSIGGNSNSITLRSGDALTITSGSNNNLLAASSGTDNIVNKGGAQFYQFGSAFGQDTINNLGSGSVGTAQGEVDFLSTSNITKSNLWFQQSGNDLLVDLMGTTDQIDIAGWYGANAGAKVTGFHDANGLKLDSQIQSLVQAMATYSAGHTGFNPQATGTVMPTDTTLQNALATAWHA
jgi:hypothetical protein